MRWPSMLVWAAVPLFTTGCWVTDAELLEWAGDSGLSGSGSGDNGGDNGGGSISIGLGLGLDVTSPHGLAFHDGQLWVGDWSTSQLYTVDFDSGSVTPVIDLLGENPVDMVSSGDRLWILTTAGALLEVDTDAGSFTEHTADSGWTGLGYDGTWLVASAGGRALTFLRTDSVQAQYTISFGGPDGPAVVDDGAFVVATFDGSFLSLTGYDATHATTAGELGGDREGGLMSNDVTGIALDGGTAWVVGSGGASSATLTSVDVSSPPW